MVMSIPSRAMEHPQDTHPAPIADFAGRVAVVTGGASGIGREMGVAGFEEYLETKSVAEPA